MTGKANSTLFPIAVTFALIVFTGAGALTAAVAVSKTKGGYIDSAVVTTQFRLRFDAAFDGDRADRAEFFYGKCACFTQLFGQAGAGSPGPAGDLDFQEVEAAFEWALPQFDGRFSLFVEVPLRWIDVTLPGPEVSESGLGDLRLGFKWALVATEKRFWTLQLRAYLPTGDAKDGLGTDHASIEPGVLAYREWGRWSLQAELRLWLPLDGSPDPVTIVPDTSVLVNGTRSVLVADDPVDNDDFAGEVVRAGIGISREYSLAAGIKLAPVVEVVGWEVLDGFATPPVGVPPEEAAATILNLKVGLRITGRGGRSIYAGYGKALTDDLWYDAIWRFEYRQPLAWR